MEEFPYTSLDVHNHEIRILVSRADVRQHYGPSLIPTNPTFSLWEVMHVSLIDTDPYMALSYCWGNPTLPKFISLKPYKGTIFQKVAITENLHSALAAVCKRWGSSGGDLRIWVDALCINQGDIYERSQQVQMMRQIYSKAEKVLAWVGPDAGKILSPETVECLSQMQKLDSPRNQPLGEAQASRSNPVQNGEERSVAIELPFSASPFEESCDVLMSFFDEEYWKRAWIIQEVTVASTVRVMYGDLDFSWEDVVAVLSVLVKTPAQGTDRRGVAASHLLKFREHFVDGNKPISLFQAMAWTLHTKATDPRDKIFALLGLCYDGFRLVQVPNYKQSLESIISEMSRLSMSLHRSLDLMCLKGTNTKLNASNGLLTWAPNWPNLWSGGRTKHERILLKTQASYRSDPILEGSTKSTIVVEAVYLGQVLGITSGVAAGAHHTRSRTIPHPWIFSTSDLRREVPQLTNGSDVELIQRRCIWRMLTYEKGDIDPTDASECFTSLWTPRGRGSIYSTQIINWIDDNAWFQIGHWNLWAWSQLEGPIQKRSKTSALHFTNSKSVVGRDNPWVMVNKVLEDKLGSGLRLAEVNFLGGAASFDGVGAALVHPHAEVADELFFVRGCTRSVTLRRTAQSANRYTVVGPAGLDGDTLGLYFALDWAQGKHDKIDPAMIRVLRLE